MSLQKERAIGQQILARIDRLIEIVIAVALKKPQETERDFEEGCQIIAELFNLLEQIIGPQSEYRNIAIKEMVTQRIPDQRILDSFDLQPLLEAMFQQVSTQVSTDNPAVECCDCQVETETMAKRDQVERALDLLFRNETVLKKHRHDGLYFDYYLPSQKIAVAENGLRQGEEKAIREYLRRKDGIRVVSVDSSMAGYREIARQIKRQLAI